MTPETTICPDCLQEFDDADGFGKCETCHADDVRFDWLDATEAEARKLAESHGWSFDRSGGGVGTSSRYYELIREGEDEDGDDAEQALTLRISDHGSCYCSEDLSLAMEPSGDDHTMDDLRAALTAPFKAD